MPITASCERHESCERSAWLNKGTNSVLSFKAAIVGVGITITHDPSTDPDERISRIRLLPQVMTPMRRKG